MKGAMENEWLCKTMPTVWWWWVILYNAYPHHHNYNITVLLHYCKYAYTYVQVHGNIMPLTTPVISEPTGMDGLGWWDEWSGKGMWTSSMCTYVEGDGEVLP